MCYLTDPEGNIVELQVWATGANASIYWALNPLAMLRQRLGAVFAAFAFWPAAA